MNMDKYFMWIHYERLKPQQSKAQQNRVHISWDILYFRVWLLQFKHDFGNILGTAVLAASVFACNSPTSEGTLILNLEPALSFA